MQSLSRQDVVNPLVENYGQVIVDECHHVGAVSFDAILKRTKAKYVLGLTATPFRRDGQQPIIFMQCGPIRYTAPKPVNAPHDLEVVPRMMHKAIDLPPDAPRVLLATGKLIGEGFDHPALDSLVLAMPVSWKGTLQQYAGRLHREHINKTDIRIIDFVDSGHPALMRMWEKRQRGYHAMGYRIGADLLQPVTPPDTT